MRRRQFIATAAGLSLAAVGPASGSPSQTAYEPLGTVPLENVKEVVASPDNTTAYAAVMDGFATVDITDPANPTVLVEKREILADRENGPLEAIQDVKVDGDRLAVAGPANAGSESIKAVVFYDVSDPAAPEQLAVYETDYFIHNVAFVDGIAYLPANGRDFNALVTVELDGDAARQLGRWSIFDHEPGWADVAPGLRTLHDIYVQDGIAYLAHWDAGTWAVDVSDPTNPSLITKLRGRSPGDLDHLSGQSRTKEAIQPPGNDHYVAVNDDATLLAVGGESWDFERDDDEGGPSGIDLYDVSTLTDPQQLATIDPPPTADATFRGTWVTSHNFDLADDRLYTSWYQGGVRVFDVSDPANPNELAAWRDSDRTSFWTAQSAGDFFVASSRSPSDDDSTTARLFTFPDPREDLFTGTRTPLTPVPSATDSNSTDTGGSGGTGSGTSTTGTATPAGTSASTTDGPDGSAAGGDGTTTPDSNATGPGFGALTALVGLGIGAWRLRTDED